MLQHRICMYLCILEPPGSTRSIPPAPTYPSTYYLRVFGAPACSLGTCTCASPLGHLQCFRPLNISLQFLELSDTIYRRCTYTREPSVNAKVPPFPPLCRNPLRSTVSLPFTSGVCCTRSRP
jgi:hypothetical protein